ncbi:hypothetical protein AX774_g7791 [Zancudomyces culisetae]|uniref:Protein YOP1 n=1 Tax=Zancudomyces culisetae TaxID=1213189 RepID=A0A1R1PCW8_ZANCU|nr:hypothetical protein AX774_g7791 [Zancudomyces culisetae]|eukprot:OMH78810.1 hypothetical protein AX774_g7791 [Zancudomyces culisetae]
MIFSGINVLEYFSGFLTYWIPFYYVFKLALLIWLASPHYQVGIHFYLSELLLYNRAEHLVWFVSKKEGRGEPQRHTKRFLSHAASKPKNLDVLYHQHQHQHQHQPPHHQNSRKTKPWSRVGGRRMRLQCFIFKLAVHESGKK